jgi:uncharacterized protein YndB with AHSA1/START domain
MTKSYSTSFTFAKSPAEVFAAVLDPRAWWGEGIVGETDRVGGQFIYRHEKIHVSTQTVSEIVANARVVWDISKSHLSFVDKTAEWDGTQVIFDIAKDGPKTRLTVTHAGLVPQFQCYKDCSAGWNYYLNDSLKPLVETGRGSPDPKSKAAA